MKSKLKPTRANQILAFQPTIANLKLLRPARRKLRRGEVTATINRALDFYRSARCSPLLHAAPFNACNPK